MNTSAPTSSQESSASTTSTPNTVGTETIPSYKSLRARAQACGVWSGSDDASESPSSSPPPPTRPIDSLAGMGSSDWPFNTAPSRSDSIVHHCAPKMWRILSVMNPLMSFAELRQTLGISMEEVSAEQYSVVMPDVLAR